MYSFRAVLTKCGVRTPLMVTVSLIGSTHWLQHRRRSHWSSESLPFVHSMSPFGLRSVYLWSSSGSGGDRRDSVFGGAGPESATGSPQKGRTSPPIGSPQASPNAGPDLTVEKICEESFEAVVSVRQMLTPSDKEKAHLQRVHNTSSGFIVDENFILTSARAVGNAKVVQVKLKGSAKGTRKEPLEGSCKVVYKEPELDLALLAPLTGTTHQLKLAEVTDDYPWYADKVVALGSSWDYNTVTNGIVSCPKRTGGQITKIGKKYGFITTGVNYIQHTASFAFDDYGGALLDMKGKVVGMYFYLQLIDNIVLYFAVPSNKIKDFVRDGIKYSKTPQESVAESKQDLDVTLPIGPKTPPKPETPEERQQREKKEEEKKQKERERKKKIKGKKREEKKEEKWKGMTDEEKEKQRERERKRKEAEERRRKEEEERKRQGDAADKKKKEEEALKKRIKEKEEERKKKTPKKQPQKRDPRRPPPEPEPELEPL